MSWNKNIFSRIYKRDQKFNYTSWLFEDYSDECYWDDWLWSQEMLSYDDFGAPKSMAELYQYRLLTLLHHMKIRSATKTIDQIGWY